MPKNQENTSSRIGGIASRALRGKKISQRELKSLAGSVLTQRPDKKS